MPGSLPSCKVMKVSGRMELKEEKQAGGGGSTVLAVPDWIVPTSCQGVCPLGMVRLCTYCWVSNLAPVTARGKQAVSGQVFLLLFIKPLWRFIAFSYMWNLCSTTLTFFGALAEFRLQCTWWHTLLIFYQVLFWVTQSMSLQHHKTKRIMLIWRE